MTVLPELFENNKRWAAEKRASDPAFFEKLAKGQSPPYLWIGCADSRAPAAQVLGLGPGEVFVHRNIANVVSSTDFNCLSVLQYAVEALKVRHIIVCGHYGCGGVTCAIEDQPLGLIDNWLRQVKDVYHASDLATRTFDTKEDRVNALCEANVAAQVRNVCHTTIVQDAWARKQKLAVHGLIFSLANGRLKDLEVSARGAKDIEPLYRMAFRG